MSDFNKYECTLCGFVYDEVQGFADDGIAPGTKWQDVPDTWTCPDCDVTKLDFQKTDA
jgi:rubredoxin